MASSLSHKDRHLASLLAAQVVEGGEQSLPLFRTNLAKISASMPQLKKRQFLQYLSKSVAREWRMRELIIEHAGPLSADDTAKISAHFQNNTGRKLRTITRNNESLIAGIRVTLDDISYDTSIAGQLDRLAASIN